MTTREPSGGEHRVPCFKVRANRGDKHEMIVYIRAASVVAIEGQGLDVNIYLDGGHVIPTRGTAGAIVETELGWIEARRIAGEGIKDEA